jgi:hypothetical protein
LKGDIRRTKRAKTEKGRKRSKEQNEGEGNSMDKKKSHYHKHNVLTKIKRMTHLLLIKKKRKKKKTSNASCLVLQSMANSQFISLDFHARSFSKAFLNPEPDGRFIE